MSASAGGGGDDVKRVKVTLDDWTELYTLAVWLGKSSDLAFNIKRVEGVPTIFHVGGGKYLHWKIKMTPTRTVLVEYVDRLEKRDGTPKLTRDGEERHEELWDTEADVVVTLIASDRPDARNPGQPHKLKAQWSLYDRSIFWQDKDGNVSREEVEGKIGFKTLHVKFTQNDTNHTLAWKARENNTGPWLDVLTHKTHKSFARALVIERGIPMEIALEIVRRIPGIYDLDSFYFVMPLEGDDNLIWTLPKRWDGDNHSITMLHKVPYKSPRPSPKEKKRTRTEAHIAAMTRRTLAHAGKTGASCAVCGEAATSQCSSCKSQFYCDKICQKAAWLMGHQIQCKGV